MSQYPRRVLRNSYVPWPSAQFPVFVRGGSMVDILPGSALETAYGAGNLSPVQTWPGDGATWDKSALSN
ncbi:MAG TPA: hypothetical protein VGI66_03735 [Streptosporangiaceae bacterium]|jgi:hypothetical protein